MFTGYLPKKHGNGRIQFVDVRKLKFDDALNIRWHGGSTIEGLSINVDTRDVAGMGFQIKEKAGIVNRLVLSQRGNGDLVILQGNRRGSGAQWLLDNDPEVKKEDSALFKVLTKETPAIIFTDLTADEERLLVNDQEGLKGYLRSEIVRQVYAMVQVGRKFDDIGSSMVEQIASALGKKDKLAEYRAIPPDQHEMRKKYLLGWLKGTLSTYWMDSYRLGIKVRQCVLLSELQKDGLMLGKDDPKPYFFTTTKSQKRIGDLKKAAKEDADAGQWDEVNGGPKMNALIEEYHKEDFNDDGTVKESEATPKKGMNDGDINKALKEGKVKSPIIQAAFKAVTGDFTGNLEEFDNKAMSLHLKESTFLQYKAVLPDGPVKECLSFVFGQNDVAGFEKFLSTQAGGATPTKTPTVDASGNPVK